MQHCDQTLFNDLGRRTKHATHCDREPHHRKHSEQPAMLPMPEMSFHHYQLSLYSQNIIDLKTNSDPRTVFWCPLHQATPPMQAWESPYTSENQMSNPAAFRLTP